MDTTGNRQYAIWKHNSAFSLAEVIASLMITAMVLVAVLTIYSRAQNSAAAITRKLDSSRLACEVLQRIAEDVDKIIAVGSDTTVTIQNRFDTNGYPTARLTILKTIYDPRNQQQPFEEIIWQTGYDYESDANGLVLYRSYTGIGLEDRLLDEQRTDLEKDISFVPICSGVTCFKVQVPRGKVLQDEWTSSTLPPGIVVTISFAVPFRTLTNTLDVPDAEKTTRTIAVDRTRTINFEITETEDEEPPDKKA